MTYFLLGAALMLAPAQPEKPCPCSPQCSCGCNQGRPCTCGNAPVAAPGGQMANYGVDLSKVGKGPKYARNGKEVTKGQAIAAVEGKLPDDAKLLRVTVIGSEVERKTVLADLDSHPALAGYKGRFVVQAYPPDHWAVRGFVTTGRPTIYVQRPDGKVLHRQDAYAGPEAFAGALRKADPAYDPVKDPDATKPKGPLPFDVKDVPTWAWLAIAGAALYIFSDKSK